MRLYLPTFDRHLLYHVVRAICAVLAVLCVLFAIINLTEELEDVGKGGYLALDAIAVTILTTPARAVDLLPVSTLLGALLGLGQLAAQRELIAMRALGLTRWRLARPLLILAAVLTALAFALRTWVVPPVERQAQEFRTKALSQTALGGSEFWSRHGRTFVHVGGIDFGRIPRAIEIYDVGAHGRLARVLFADKADTQDGKTWILHDVDERVLGTDTVEHRRLAQLAWQSILSPEEMAALVAPAHALSLRDLHLYLEETGGADLDTRRYQLLFWQQLSLAPALFAMLLLALPFVLGVDRSRSAGSRVLLGGTIGITFYLLQQIAAQVVQLLELPPAGPALAPALSVLAIAIIALRRLR